MPAMNTYAARVVLADAARPFQPTALRRYEEKILVSSRFDCSLASAAAPRTGTPLRGMFRSAAWFPEALPATCAGSSPGTTGEHAE
jgi:hypothetical protein